MFKNKIIIDVLIFLNIYFALFFFKFVKVALNKSGVLCAIFKDLQKKIK